MNLGAWVGARTNLVIGEDPNNTNDERDYILEGRVVRIAQRRGFRDNHTYEFHTENGKRVPMTVHGSRDRVYAAGRDRNGNPSHLFMYRNQCTTLRYQAPRDLSKKEIREEIMQRV